MYFLNIHLLVLEDQRNQNLSSMQYQRHELVILVSLGGFWQIKAFNFRMMNTNECVNSSTLKFQKHTAESLWSNGLCERYNGVIKEYVKKVVEDVRRSLETAIAWAVSAKNSLHSHNGYSPNQNCPWKNPNMPSVLKDKTFSFATRRSMQHNCRKQFEGYA